MVGLTKESGLATEVLREGYGHHSGKGYTEYSGGIPSLVLSSLLKKIGKVISAILNERLGKTKLL